MNSSSRRPRRGTSDRSRPRRGSRRKPSDKRPSADRSKPTEQRQPAARRKPPSDTSSGFRRFSLRRELLAALDRAGYSEPTPIQEQLIPEALLGRDVLGQAQTGTGKTAAFAIPILERLEGRGKAHRPLAIVLTPTRELAVQVRDEFARLADGQPARIAAAYGGKPIRQQIEKLKRGVDILVATPGRVLDLMSRRALDLSDLQFVVLDEADRMLDIGFRPDIERILKRAPRERQTLLLSATVPPPIERLAQRYMHDPITLEVSPENVTVETIDQYYFTVEPTRKFELLVKLLEREQPRQSIVFCRTKRGTQRIYQRLRKQFQGVECIHGDMTQGARDRVMRAFRDGKVKCLVATDVVGRGIDVSGISHIINYDIPHFSDDYVHRVGRTGRMGREGVAYTFVAPEEGRELTRIEQRINRLLKRAEIGGFERKRVDETAETEAAEADRSGREEPPPPPSSAMKRPRRRYRRAL